MTAVTGGVSLIRRVYGEGGGEVSVPVPGRRAIRHTSQPNNRSGDSAAAASTAAAISASASNARGATSPNAIASGTIDREHRQHEQHDDARHQPVARAERRHLDALAIDHDRDVIERNAPDEGGGDRQRHQHGAGEHQQQQDACGAFHAEAPAGVSSSRVRALYGTVTVTTVPEGSFGATVSVALLP